MIRALALGVALAAAAALCIVAARGSASSRAFDGAVQALRVPPVTLTDDRGLPVRLDAPPRGAIVVLGYTRCTDECPLTLAKVAVALRSVDASMRPGAYFVTVDPAHDDPGTLHRYLAAWHDAIAGVTGEPRALAALSLALDAGDGQRKARDHDTRVFLIARDGGVRAELSPETTPAALAEAVRRDAAGDARGR